MNNLLRRITGYFRKSEEPFQKLEELPQKPPKIFRKKQITMLDRVPQEQKDIWLREYLNFSKVPEIAKRHHVRPWMVRNHLLSTQTTYSDVCRKRVALWIAKFKSGKTIVEISREHPATSQYVIARHLKKAGVPGIHRGRTRKSIDSAPKLERACQLRQEGKPWREIAVILQDSNFKKLGERTRAYAARSHIVLPRFWSPHAEDTETSIRRKHWETLYREGKNLTEISRIDGKSSRKTVFRYLVKVGIHTPQIGTN